MTKPSHSGPESRRDDVAGRLSFNSKGYTDILVDFARQVKDESDDWSPEELEKRKKSCLNQLEAFKKDESARIFEEISHDFQEIDKASRGASGQIAPTTPPKKKMTAEQLVETVAAHIRFG